MFTNPTGSDMRSVTLDAIAAGIDKLDIIAALITWVEYDTNEPRTFVINELADHVAQAGR